MDKGLTEALESIRSAEKIIQNETAFMTSHDGDVDWPIWAVTAMGHMNAAAGMIRVALSPAEQGEEFCDGHCDALNGHVEGCPLNKPDPTAAVVGSMVEPVDDDDPVVKIGRIGNELHNHSLQYQDDSDEYEFLSDVAVRLWASQNQIRSRIADLEEARAFMNGENKRKRRYTSELKQRIDDLERQLSEAGDALADATAAGLRQLQEIRSLTDQAKLAGARALMVYADSVSRTAEEWREDGRFSEASELERHEHHLRKEAARLQEGGGRG